MPVKQNQKTDESRGAGGECILNAEGLSSLIQAAAEFGVNREGREGWKVFLLGLCGVRQAEMVVMRWREMSFSTGRIQPPGGPLEGLPPKMVRVCGLRMEPVAAKMLWALRAGPRDFVVDSPEEGERALFTKVRRWLRGQGVGGHSPLRAVRAAGIQAQYDREMNRGLCHGLAAAVRALGGVCVRSGRPGGGVRRASPVAIGPAVAEIGGPGLPDLIQAHPEPLAR